MATYYVYSGAAGAGTGADWANAFTTLAAAVSGKAAGDIFYVAHDHAESQASAMTITVTTSAAAITRIICVDRSGSVPPVSADLRATATITTTGANAITLAASAASGFFYCYGLIFSAGTGAVTSGLSLANVVFDTCALKKLGTSASTSAIAVSASTNTIVLINTTMTFGAATDAVNIAGNIIWKNTPSALSGPTLTTGLFSLINGGIIEGVDLSALNGASTIIRAFALSTRSVVLKDVKLGSSVTVAATPTSYGATVSLIRGDSGDTNYRTEKYMYAGTLTTETTIVRTGGASDGTTPISWKVITTANSSLLNNFECFPITIWNETVGSPITVTVECRGAAVPNNDEVWMDVEYLGTSGFPLGNFATSGVADVLATGSACTSSSETWGGSTSSFKLEATITPQEKGPITVYVKIAKASSTFYIDPKITIS